ncbi:MULTISPECIES: hypothetical protein, partial [unclassified Streptomyces]|uniref:hypothetical protein n=1 Tax=unclassified Streptomyces TaxID=2593676 RepID=UPI001EEF9C86
METLERENAKAKNLEGIPLRPGSDTGKRLIESETQDSRTKKLMKGSARRGPVIRDRRKRPFLEN